MSYYDNRKIRSYKALLNKTDTTRNIGKTWSWKISGIIGFIKHHSKIEWLRYFRKDVKETMKKRFYSKKMIKIINDELNGHGSKHKWKLTLENFKQDGAFVYYRKDKKHKWEWFIAVHALSDEQAIKSSDDPDVRYIVFEEYRITPDKLARYRGDPVTDFLSIWTTVKRDNRVRVFLLGNKECISDPFSSYFGIPAIDTKFQGIKTFKHGTIAVEQINDVPEETKDDFDAQFRTLLDGTGYGDFLFKGEIRNLDRSRIRTKPKGCYIYCCFDVGRPITAWIDKYQNLYFENGIDSSRTVAVDKASDKYRSAYVISAGDKTSRFSTLNYLFKMNKVFYADEKAFEQGFKVLKILGIVKAV